MGLILLIGRSYIAETKQSDWFHASPFFLNWGRGLHFSFREKRRRPSPFNKESLQKLQLEQSPNLEIDYLFIMFVRLTTSQRCSSKSPPSPCWTFGPYVSLGWIPWKSAAIFDVQFIAASRFSIKVLVWFGTWISIYAQSAAVLGLIRIVPHDWSCPFHGFIVLVCILAFPPEHLTRLSPLFQTSFLLCTLQLKSPTYTPLLCLLIPPFPLISPSELTE